MNIITLNSKDISIRNDELAVKTRNILDMLTNMKENQYNICWEMYNISKTRMYAIDYTSMAEYGEKVFGYKKSNTYSMISIGERFLHMDNETNSVKCNMQEYSITQLTLLLTLPDPVISELEENGQLHYSMTCKDIKKLLKNMKAKEIEDNENDFEYADTDTVKDLETETETGTEKIAYNFTYAEIKGVMHRDEIIIYLNEEDMLNGIAYKIPLSIVKKNKVRFDPYKQKGE